jgi:hypothetical protein
MAANKLVNRSCNKGGFSVDTVTVKAHFLPFPGRIASKFHHNRAVFIQNIPFLLVNWVFAFTFAAPNSSL